MTFRSDVYQISGATAAGAVITSWDCGTIPAENVDVQTSNGGWRSTLTLTNITPGVYPLVCTVNSDNNGEIYSVRATVTLAVEAGETEYTLTFDANGGTGAPAAMTGGTNRFVIPDTIRHGTMPTSAAGRSLPEPTARSTSPAILSPSTVG